jgi:predicted ABC-type ATPase
LAGPSYLKLINDLKANGWVVELVYLALPNIEMSKKRVAERVKHGGHNIPL